MAGEGGCGHDMRAWPCCELNTQRVPAQWMQTTSYGLRVRRPLLLLPLLFASRLLRVAIFLPLHVCTSFVPSLVYLVYRAL